MKPPAFASTSQSLLRRNEQVQSVTKAEPGHLAFHHFVNAATIAALTLMPPGSLPAGTHGIDKLYHIVAFAALISPTALLRPKWCLAVGCLAILYGEMIEVIQPSFGGLRTLRTSWSMCFACDRHFDRLGHPPDVSEALIFSFAYAVPEVAFGAPFVSTGPIC